MAGLGGEAGPLPEPTAGPSAKPEPKPSSKLKPWSRASIRA
jgi:hypothetical protein